MQLRACERPDAPQAVRVAAVCERDGVPAGRGGIILGMKTAILCIGNKLMLDDGVGPAVYERLKSDYLFDGDTDLFDAGCMGMAMLPIIRDYDFVLTVDAVDETGSEPGTVFRFEPDAIAGHGVMQSLHDLRLIDVLQAAELVGYFAEGICFGMQIENMNPSSLVIGLTPKVEAALPLLVESVVAELVRRGVAVHHADGTPVSAPDA